jgi:hypothetical protein
VPCTNLTRVSYRVPYLCSCGCRTAGVLHVRGLYPLSSRPYVPACLPSSRARTGRRRASSQSRRRGPSPRWRAGRTQGRARMRVPCLLLGCGVGVESLPSPHNTQKLRKRKVGCQDIAGTIIGRHPRYTRPSLSLTCAFEYLILLSYISGTLHYKHRIMAVRYTQLHTSSVNYDR